MIKIKNGLNKGKVFCILGKVEDFFINDSVSLRYHPAYISLLREEKTLKRKKVLFGKIGSSHAFVTTKNLRY